MNTYTKVDYIELLVPNVTSGTNGVRLDFGSQSILANKLIKKIVLATRMGGSSRSPNGVILIADGAAENMWMTLQTNYDTQSGSNNQGNNIKVLQLATLLPVRAQFQNFGGNQWVGLARNHVPDWTGVFVNWEKSYILINFQPDSLGGLPGNQAIVFAVYYEDMYNSQGIPLQQPLEAEQAKNVQLRQQLGYLKTALAQRGIRVPETPASYFNNH